MDAIILAGGKGSRMEDALPKVLVQIRGKAILDYQLNYLKSKVDKIVLALGHRADEVIEHVQKFHKDEPIEFSIEDEPLGTGGAIKKAMRLCATSRVLVFNCDDLTDIDIKKLEVMEENVICIAHPRLPFGLVKEENGYAVFVEKPILPDWVSCGWYAFNKDELMELLPDKGSIEYEVFPKIKLRVYKHEGYWRSTNTKKDVDEIEKEGLPEIFLAE
jgi:mannose-1-phosphate guanylyltransferase